MAPLAGYICAYGGRGDVLGLRPYGVVPGDGGDAVG